ncbi:MAG: asparagine synthase (glutamine-hydrolyzing) [Proteobacteria bacterium]|nr:asparagine synthase (glutamine-hydrolyzing) [Pseudomonadota bacterium]
MCGIFGYFDRNGISLNSDELKKMGDAIRHRGPDDFGVFESDGVSIGNQRLSIIDLENGHQPFISEDGQVAVVQNGEIYNYLELAKELKDIGNPCKTQSDTEVLLKLYQSYGINFLDKLNGMFSIAIYDNRNKVLHLIRDRVGVKPLYIHDNGSRIYFASEIKALLRMNIPRNLDREALNHYLSFNYVPPPLTLFEGVRHLMPGHLMTISREKTETKCWWNLSEKCNIKHQTDKEWIEEFNTLLHSATELRMRADVPYGAFLSGGVDSSSVVAHMAQVSKHPIKTFSIGFEDPQYDESKYALMASQKFGTEHFTELFDMNGMNRWPNMIYFCDQPHGDVSFIPTHQVAGLARQHVKMVLTGDGGDELFAGYDKYLTFFSRELPKDYLRDYFNSISVFSEEQKKSLFIDNYSHAQSSVEFANKIFNKVEHCDPINQALYFDTMMLLPGNNLVKPDRMGMAVSLEARTPFLDYRMVEFAFSMPGTLKLREGETKYIYKKAVSQLIGEELTYRKKQMFTVPIGDWFRGKLSQYVKDLLLSNQFIDRRLFKPEVVACLVEQHLAGIANYTRELRALAALEIWCRRFLDES